MHLDYLSVIILSLIEGLTEFLPVSSTGHLVIANHLLSLSGDKVNALDVFIQAGAILAVIAYYPVRFANLINFNSAEGLSGKAGITKIAVASFPALILGALLHSTIKERWFNPFSVSLALITGAIFLILAERYCRFDKDKAIEEVSIKDCLIIGLVQCLSLWPGFSRAGASIIGGLCCGLSKRASAEFSFFLAVPVIFAASAYDLYKNIKFLNFEDLPFFALGAVLSFIFALFSIRFFLNLLQRFSLSVFAVYRIILGLTVLAIL
jgi:undecaprenyl-diphosphatase